MANAPLNPPVGTNNLLALTLQRAPMGRGDVCYADSGEPAGVVVTATSTTVIAIPFSLNGAGNQPAVSQGAVGIIVGSVGTQATVGAITVEACDSTATNAGHVEFLDTWGAFPLAEGGCYLRPFASSLSAGADVQGSIANVVSIRLTVPITGTGSATIKAVAVGTP